MVNVTCQVFSHNVAAFPFRADDDLDFSAYYEGFAAGT